MNNLIKYLLVFLLISGFQSVFAENKNKQYYIENMNGKLQERKEYYLDKVSENVWFLSLDVEILVRKYKAASPRIYPISGTPSTKQLSAIFLHTLTKATQEIESISQKVVASISFSNVTGRYQPNNRKNYGYTPITGYFINLKDKE